MIQLIGLMTDLVAILWGSRRVPNLRYMMCCLHGCIRGAFRSRASGRRDGRIRGIRFWTARTRPLWDGLGCQYRQTQTSHHPGFEGTPVMAVPNRSCQSQTGRVIEFRLGLFFEWRLPFPEPGGRLDTFRSVQTQLIWTSEAELVHVEYRQSLN